MCLSGQQLKQFRDALLDAFSPEEFDAMLLFELNLRRTDFILGPNQQTVVLETIQAMQRRNRVGELLEAARRYNPDDPKLLAFAQQTVRATSVPTSTSSTMPLERTIHPANSLLDPKSWLTRAVQIINQVCRIAVPADPPDFGTGFLLGPNVIMTAYHVVEKAIRGQVAPTEVELRFDYALMADGVAPNPGTVHRLAKEKWLIDHSEHSPLDLQTRDGNKMPRPDQLDYALLRIAGAPGGEPVGGQSNRDSNAPLRGWVELPTESHHFESNTPVFIVQHPDGGPLKLALDTASVIGTNVNKNRVYYRTNTEGGSSGSPCFDVNWNLVALHQRGDPKYNQGIPFAAIIDLLEQRGKKDELEMKCS